MDWLRSDWFADAQAHAHDAEDAVIRVYDEAGNVIDTHEHAGQFREQLPTKN